MNKNVTYMVSVRLMTYHHEAYIAEAIQSVLDQKTDFNVELVIGDDFSTDNTLNIINSFNSTKNIHIKVLKREKGDDYWKKRQKLGRLYNFANIIENCSGKYIALLDGDDYWTDPYKLQKQFDFLENNPDCISCHHWHEYGSLKEDGTYEIKVAPTIGQGYLPKGKATVREIFDNKMRVKTRTHYFRNILSNFPDWFYEVSYGDVALSFILGKYGKFGFIDEAMAVYRQTGEGASTHGKGGNLFYLHHFINWVKVWEYGLIHHNYNYYPEAKNTILYFYTFILKKYFFSIRVFIKLLKYSTFQSKLTIRKRAVISINLIKVFVVNFIQKLYHHLKFKVQNTLEHVK